uniref:Uncharacterized protein n=1 Tax=uncultured marine virus TaxID=186617 RepID=A0A0F7L1I1_9VIRU|nr:hypothetical protein [uncultured marine virus]
MIHLNCNKLEIQALRTQGNVYFMLERKLDCLSQVVMVLNLKGKQLKNMVAQT